MSRIVVLEWSHSGQSREVTDALVTPLVEAGHQVERVKLAVDTTYPFPWTPVQFFGLFPETVLMRPPPAKPIELPEGEIDLVIASGSIWYLRPCQPWQAFLAGPQADWLSGRRVLTLTTCRNMWINGWRIWVEKLREHGANVVDRVTVTHSGPVFASFYTTVYWSVTGKREVAGLPKVEIDAETLERVAGFGRTLAERLPGDGALLADLDTAPVSHAHAFPELLFGRIVFPTMATIYAALSSPGTLLRSFFAIYQMVFILSAITVLAIPFILVNLLFGRWLDPWVEQQARLG